MKLILHIGTEKTGTTSLQEWMAVNRAALSESGIYYPRSLGEKRHLDLSVFASSRYQDGQIALRVRKIKTQADLEAYRDTVQQKFRAEMRKAARVRRHRVCVISDEGLQVRLGALEEAERVRDLLRPLFGQIEVVVALRPQVDYAVSLVSTLVRLGNPIGAEWFAAVTPDNSRFDYDGLVGRWEQAFGPENLRVVPYKRNPDSVQVFADLLGLKRADFVATERKNSFVDWRTLRVANSLDREKAKQFRELIDELGAVEPLQIGASLAAEVTGRFAAGNARLVARRAELTEDDLLPEMRRYQGAENLSLIKAKIPRSELPQAVYEALFR